MKEYYKIRFIGAEEPLAITVAELAEFGSIGYEEESADTITAVFPREQWSDDNDIKLKILEVRLNVREISREIVEEEDWNRRWEESIEPVRLEEGIVVTPTWKQPAVMPGDIVIQVDPKMAFGTGHHETTRLMLRLLMGEPCGGRRVLDVGCGTGILGIAAVKRGAIELLGIDTDHLAVENSIETAALNEIEPAEFREGDLTAVTEDGFDIVMANITLNTILSMVHRLAGKVRDGGALMLSGFYGTDVERIVDAFKGGEHAHGYTMVEERRVHEHEWSALCMRRRGAGEGNG